MKRIATALFSMFTTSCLLIVFAIAIAYATFVENGYGTETARILIYNAWWFNLLLVATGINLVGGLIYYKAFQLKRWSMVLFHLAFIVILVGAGITRFFSYEGNIHIREGESSNQLVTTDTYIQVQTTTNGTTNSEAWKVGFSPYTLNNFDEGIAAGNNDLNVEVVDYVPSAEEHILPDASGGPIISLITLKEKSSRKDITMQKSQEVALGNLLVSFEGATKHADVYIELSADSLIMKTTDTLSVVSMMGTTTQQIPPGAVTKIQPRGMYQIGDYLFALKDYQPRARIVLAEATGKQAGMSKDAIKVKLSMNGEQKQIVLFGGKNDLGVPIQSHFGNTDVDVSYGARIINLPFKIHLDDFQLERYPGSRSPSSFASEVTLIDPRNNLSMPYRIFMNNILDYEGYRFFQSSYDTDEKGTILSVSHDFWGTAITYVGYFLMALGMVFTFFNKKSRFHALLRASARLKTLKSKSHTATILVLLLGLSAVTNSVQAAPISIKSSHVRSFEKLLVQDPKGRIEPVNTLASEVLRKLNRKSSFEGMSASEVFLAMSAQPEVWRNIQIIKVANSELQTQLGLPGKYVSYNQMFDPTTHAYKLSQLIDETYKKKPTARSKFDKEVINVDERMNILYQIFNGDFLKVFPIPNDPSNAWVNEKKFYTLSANANDRTRLLTN
ncbi:MAG TPA: cytochrome c biogenesis protein ResB, partial [Sunxiuqinia sp.]|nr:cytochrome c biogenesis protein ResB [Sunxiuqinia sp.]